jgi:carbohydrate binding protein with CBM6 domain
LAAPPTPSPSVYRTRAYQQRQRALLGLAALGLLLVGYLLGRWQDSPSDPAAAAVAPPAGAAASSEPAPPSAEPTTEAPKPTVYRVLQAEEANGNGGTDSQDTEDEGGGKNVGWIAEGDWLRFDDFDFGPVPATQLESRVASEAGNGGRMEIRLDTQEGPVIGTLNVTGTQGWQTWRTDVTTITPTTGRHTVFLVFRRSDGNDFLNLNWIKFGH